MQEFLKVTGMVIGAYPQGEYDRRIVLLTRERGKITAFVKGARRPQSRFLGSTDMFTFGTFDLFVGKTSYNVQNVEIQNYFEFLRSDLEAAFYGCYFLELADYYAIENNDESLLILLIYRSLQGLKSDKFDNAFVRRIFEIKLFMIEGEFIPVEKCGSFSDSLYNTVDYIQDCSIEKLFGFKVTDALFAELETLADFERRHLVDKKLSSLDMLNTVI